jgi:hypothetical protein
VTEPTGMPKGEAPPVLQMSTALAVTPLQARLSLSLRQDAVLVLQRSLALVNLYQMVIVRIPKKRSRRKVLRKS